jgi:hypothetical protein
MKWNSFKLIQLACWLSSFALIILALTNASPFKEKQDSLLELLGSLSVASVAVNEVYDRWAKKFGAAQVLAIGYIENCIEPVVQGLLKKYPLPAVIKPVYIFIPPGINSVNNASVNTLLHEAEFTRQKETVRVITPNREDMEIAVITNVRSKKQYYFDVPNTLSSLKALIDYKLKKKANSRSDKEKETLEKKYLEIFRKEVERLVSEKELGNKVKVIDSIDKLL